MTTAHKTSTVVLVFVAGACALSQATIALASTGGTSGGASVPASTSAPATAPAGSAAAVDVRGATIATWFGPGLYGRQTACGQTLTPQVVGVANRTLPCGTLVKVTYAGRNLTLPVVDRGPYSHHASWDLTAGAAEALGITETVRIVTHVVGKVANTPDLGLPAGSTSSGGGSSGGALAG